MKKENIKKSKSNVSPYLEQAKGMDPSSTKKYAKWISKQLEDSYLPEDIKATVEFFHRNVQRFEERDIYKYENLKTLEDLVKELGESTRKTRSNDKSGAQLIYKDDRWNVHRIDTKEAAGIYGANTKWCITTQNASYFENYSEKNDLFYFIEDKTAAEKAHLSKVCYRVCRDSKNKVTKTEIYDSRDSLQKDQEIDKIVEVSEDIISLIQKDIEVCPKTTMYRLVSGELSTEETVSLFYKAEKLYLEDNDSSLMDKVFEFGALSQATFLQLSIIGKLWDNIPGGLEIVQAQLDECIKNGDIPLKTALTAPK